MIDPHSGYHPCMTEASAVDERDTRQTAASQRPDPERDPEAAPVPDADEDEGDDGGEGGEESFPASDPPSTW
ncbi:MAG: hypothetical protein ACR2KC_04910 [Acidimicrobiales bacterium]